jgi:ATP-dependent helicase HepA
MKKNVRRSLILGQFVSSSENTFGTGSLVAIKGKDAEIEYFDSPAKDTHSVQIVSVDTVRAVQLEQQQRVYFRDPNTLEWQVGRVLDYQADDYQYLVQFPNRDRKMLQEGSLQTRCRKPITDPTDQLAFGLNETAYWHAGRARFVRSVFDQRRACGGMTAILSSAIDIEMHQVAVVRRVLQDSVQRYLLADEVGLGKTIEAGLLIRQYVLDEPTEHSVLIIVPTALLRQWREELRTRFFLDAYLGRTIHLVALNDRERIERFGRNAGMIVIDEAHHLAAGAWSHVEEEAAVFALVAAITRPLERKLLLLSATPALHNERGFLAMLHLLDPSIYSLDDVEAFQERVRKRQHIAEVLSALQIDEPNLFVQQAVENLWELAPHDRHLTVLSRELARYLEEDPDQDDAHRTYLLTQLRSHISETWRLHRRILRTRRSKETQVLLPGRDGAFPHLWPCPQYTLLDEAFNAWRFTIAQAGPDACAASTREQLVRVMAEAMVCDPLLLPLLVSTRLGDDVNLDGLDLFPDQLQSLRTVPIADGESGLLTRLSNLAANLDVQAYYRTLVALIEGELQSAPANGISIVLFANYPVTADELYRMLQRRIGQQRVFRHSATSTLWLQALSGSGSCVLVCDRRAEEGLNLQGRRTVIVHSDLPLSPNRVEQRMGRVDRFGSGHGIRSRVLLNEQSTLQELWFRTLDTALRIFNRSVASLQYVIEAEFSQFWANFMDCGCEALKDLLDRLSGPTGLIEREFRQVQSQSELDSFDFDVKRDVQFVNDLLALDIKSSELRAAADEWIRSRLHFEWRGENNPKDFVFRYRFCRRDDSKTRSRTNDTLLPLGDLNQWMRHSFERAEDLPPEVQYESVPLTFDRQISQRRFARLARVGDPLIDAFAALFKTDDRGIAFAMWRYRPDMKDLDSPAELAFRFDFVVEAEAEPAKTVFAARRVATHTAIRRTLDSCFRPLYKTIWLDSGLQMIRDPDRIDALSRTYNADWSYVNNVRVRDFNLNRERWLVVRRWWDAEHWFSLCRQARVVAEETLRRDHDLQTVCERSVEICREQVRVRRQALESRRALSSAQTAEQLSREIELEETLAVAMETGIQHPSLRLDSVGAVFLSNQNPFAEMPGLGDPQSRDYFDE